MKKMSIVNVLVLTLSLTLATSVMAYQGTGAGNQTQSAQTDSRKMQTQVASGQKMKVQGTILSRDNDSFVLRETTGSEVTIHLAGNTKIEEKKGNPFRGAKKYSPQDVMRGLFVEVEGRGDSSGAIVADK